MRRYRYILIGLASIVFLSSCRNLDKTKLAVDRRAYGLIEEKSQSLLGQALDLDLEPSSDRLRREIFEAQGHYIASPASISKSDLPDVTGEGSASYRQEPAADTVRPAVAELRLDLKYTLEIAASHSREYQTEKERVFRSALALDLARYDFGVKVDPTSLDSQFTEDQSGSANSRGLASGADVGLSKRSVTGATFRTSLAVDLVQLMRSESASSLGIVSDSSVSIPLLRGSGAHIAGEPLTLAERNLEYALASFNFYRSDFSVRIARSYFDVLRTLDQIRNAQENYESLRASTLRVAKIAESGRMPESQVDQARQDEFRARLRLIDARNRYQARLDRLKLDIGLPVETKMTLDESDLTQLPVPTESSDGFLWTEPEHQLYAKAFDHRYDFLSDYRKVEDAQRAVVIATDGLRAELTLGASAKAGSTRSSLSSASSDNAYPHFNDGILRGLINLDLPFDRRSESNSLRTAIIDFESRMRAYQKREDELKLSIRSGLREIELNVENYAILEGSLVLAQRRVERANLMLEAGRIQVRDLLEAEEDLVQARNALTDSRVNYQILLWSLERDLGVLDVEKFI